MIKQLTAFILAATLFVGPWAFADVNARNGVAITTASTINGITPNAAINGLTIVSGAGPSLIYVGSNAGILQSSVTTAAIDTTGCDFISVFVSYYSLSLPTGPSVTDSKSNTYTIGTIYSVTNGAAVVEFRCEAPTVGSGHTFTASGTDLYGCIGAIAFTGMASTAFDQTAGAASSGGTTRQPGSITPSQANTILVSALGYNENASGSVSINSGFTEIITLPSRSGEVLGLHVAYKVMTAATATNPTWTSTGTFGESGANQVSYKY